MTRTQYGGCLRVASLGMLLLVVSISTARAQEQFRAPTWNRPSASIGLRYGSDDLNLGFGALGGYTIEPGIYVGGLFDYFLGNDAFSSWIVMAEGGYDFGVVENLVLRPILALGIIGVSFDCGNEAFCPDGTSDLELGLGGQALYLIDKLTVGGELRILFGEADAFLFGGNVGLVL